MTPEPAPGVDFTRSMQWRFRDPAFVAIWERWNRARATWARRWWDLQVDQGGSSSRYEPDPLSILEADLRAAAQEFQDARDAYRVELARRDQE